MDDSMKQSRPTREESVFGTLLQLALVPVNTAIRLLHAGWQPLLPYVVPALSLAALLPFLAVLSLGAGWMVWNSVPAPWSVPVYLQYGDGVPHGEVIIKSLVADQAYDVALHLLVPTSSSNLELGNFMASITMSTVSNRSIASANKPSMIVAPARSFLTRSPRTIVHKIHLLSNFIPGTSNVLAQVEVGRRDAWKALGRGEGKELSVLEATIVGAVNLHGVRAVIASFPLTSTFVSIIAFLAFSVAGLLVFIALYAYLSPSRTHPHPAGGQDGSAASIKNEPLGGPTLLLTPTTSEDDGSSPSGVVQKPSPPGSTRLRRRHTHTGSSSSSDSESPSSPPAQM